MVKITLTWTADDIKSIRPEWKDDQCKKFLETIKRRLKDRITQDGWDFIEEALALWEQLD